MAIRRKSTLAFARKHCAHIPTIIDALDLPMVPDILDTIDAHRGSRFVIRAAAQLFKSLLGQLRAMRCMLVEPSASLWYAHPEKFIDDFCDEKFNPLFDALPVLHPLLHTDPNKRARTRLQFPAGFNFLLRSAKVQLNRQSKTARDIYLDEPWTYEPGWCADISMRRSSFDEIGTWREIFMTTGTIATTEADQVWQSSDQRTWHSRCPECRQLFVPRRTHKDPKTAERLGGLIYETILRADGLPDEGAIAATVRYQCPNPACRHHFPDTPATRLAMNGTAAAPVGAYVALNPSPSTAPRTFGWHIPAVAVKPWAPIVLRMVKADLARSRGDLSLTKEIILKEDADTWDEEKYHRPQNQYRPAGGYRMGDAFAWPIEKKDNLGRPFRFGLIDVQLDHYWLVIRTWGPASQSRLVFTAKCFSPSEIQDLLDKYLVPRERTFADTRYDTQRVRTLCARMKWNAMMGDKEARDYRHADGIRRIYDEPKVYDAYTGTLLQNSEQGGYVIEFLFSKNAALNRLSLLRDPDARTPDAARDLLWTAADDAPDWYWQQINAHYPVWKDMPDGSRRKEWHGQKDDHADDCEAMAIVAAAMAGLTGAESLGSPEAEKSATP